MPIYIVTSPGGDEHRVEVRPEAVYGHENIPKRIVTGLLTHNGRYEGWTLNEEQANES